MTEMIFFRSLSFFSTLKCLSTWICFRRIFTYDILCVCKKNEGWKAHGILIADHVIKFLLVKQRFSRWNELAQRFSINFVSSPKIKEWYNFYALFLTAFTFISLKFFLLFGTHTISNGYTVISVKRWCTKVIFFFFKYMCVCMKCSAEEVPNKSVGNARPTVPFMVDRSQRRQHHQQQQQRQPNFTNQPVRNIRRAKNAL